MNALSLFDGIGGGYWALKKAGIKIDRYWAVECEHQNHNGGFRPTAKQWPRRIADATIPAKILRRPCHRVQDFTAAHARKIGKVDLLIAGFPCQAFSIAGHKKKFTDDRGMLFEELCRIRDLVKPAHFIFENVRPTADVASVLNNAFGVDFILANSMNYGAQHRGRAFWASSPFAPKKKMHPLTIGDIMLPPDHPEVAAMKKYPFTPIAHYGRIVKVIGTIGKVAARNAAQGGVAISSRVHDKESKSMTMVSAEGGGGGVSNKTGLYEIWGGRQGERIYHQGGKTTAIVGQGNKKRNGLYSNSENTCRALSITEVAILQGMEPKLFDDARKEILPELLPNGAIYKALGNGFDVVVVADICRQVLDGGRGQGRL